MDSVPVLSATTQRLFQLASGVLLFHVLNSVLQEAVFHLEGFNHALMLSFMQTLCIASFACLEFWRNGEERKAPITTYVLLSLLSTVSVFLTNEASHLLNYPTQVVFKSSKLLFVMVTRLLLINEAQHKHHHHRRAKAARARHRRNEFLACAMIVVGLVVFTYATSAAKMKGGSHGSDAESTRIALGVAAIVIALLCDSLLYIGEEKYCFCSGVGASNTEVILFCYMFASVNSAGSLLLSGQLVDSFQYVASHPSFVAYVVAFSLCNFCGTYFLLRVVAEFNSNSAVMVTSVRKVFTVLCSFVVYPKPFGAYHLLGLSLVSGGIYLQETSRTHTKKEEQIALMEITQEEEGLV
jgi:adenosine 3'-phospho 5'-phosphosulfate transporter B3